MAQWLVLTDHRSGQLLIPAGSVVDDSNQDVAALKREGAVVVPYTTAQDKTIADFQHARRTPNNAQTLRLRLDVNGVGPGATHTSGPMDFWVDNVAGSDLNPGTLSQPFATIQAAESLIPDIVQHPIIIHVKGSATPYALPTFRNRIYQDSPIEGQQAIVAVICDHGGTNDDGFTTLDSGTAQGGSNQTTLVTAGGIGSSQERRTRTLLIESGTSVGDRRVIREHTDTDVIPTSAFSVALQAGDAWRIVESAAILEPDTTTELYGGPLRSSGYVTAPDAESSQALMIINFKLGDTNSNELYTSGHQVWYGIEWAPAGTSFNLFGNGAQIFCGLDHTLAGTADERAGLPVSLFGAPSITSWVGWGWFSTKFVFLQGTGGQYSLSGIVCDRFPMNSGEVYIAGFNFYTLGCRLFGFDLGRKCSLILTQSDVNSQNVSGNIDGTIWGLSAEGPGARIHCFDSNVTIDAGTECVRAESGGEIYLQSGILTGPIGLIARRGGRVFFNNGNVSITAGTAETRVEDPEAVNIDRTQAGYTAVGRYIAAPDGSKVQRFL